MPPIISNAGDLLSRYRVLFCDVWGVVHNGRTAYEDGCAALTRFRTAGGTVILVSNAPYTSRRVKTVLAEKGVPEDCWDAIVPSGDIARVYAAERAYHSVYHLGPDRYLEDADPIRSYLSELDDAAAIFCTGLVRDREESADDYRVFLRPAAERNMPFVCANPDLVVDVGGVLLPCAGSLAKVYEDLGGEVYWAGKPYDAAYAAAQRKAEELRGLAVATSDILAIGDSVRTDIAGAVSFGIDALFIGQGIHRESIMPSGEFVEDELDALFKGQPQAVAAMTTLRW